MTFSQDHESQLIQWNGVSIHIPVSWEAIVSGNTHLVFEEDFHPVLEIRWEKTGSLASSRWRKIQNRWQNGLRAGAWQVKSSAQIQGLNAKFDRTSYFEDEKTGQCGGIALDTRAGTVVLFQFPVPAAKKKTALETLQSLQCHLPIHNRYRIQDFSLTLPASYDLEHYSFKAGLTTLSFNGENHKLQICRLAQASERLAAHPIEHILAILCGSKDIDIRGEPGQKNCIALHEPSLIKQLLIRLKRQPPFLRGGLHHLPDHDRLFGFVATGNSPISEELQQTIYENFKPVQKN